MSCRIGEIRVYGRREGEDNDPHVLLKGPIYHIGVSCEEFFNEHLILEILDDNYHVGTAKKEYSDEKIKLKMLKINYCFTVDFVDGWDVPLYWKKNGGTERAIKLLRKNRIWENEEEEIRLGFMVLCNQDELGYDTEENLVGYNNENGLFIRVSLKDRIFGTDVCKFYYTVDRIMSDSGSARKKLKRKRDKGELEEKPKRRKKNYGDNGFNQEQKDGIGRNEHLEIGEIMNGIPLVNEEGIFYDAYGTDDFLKIFGFEEILKSNDLVYQTALGTNGIQTDPLVNLIKKETEVPNQMLVSH